MGRERTGNLSVDSAEGVDQRGFVEAAQFGHRRRRAESACCGRAEETHRRARRHAQNA